jgi:hypothetical protein
MGALGIIGIILASYVVHVFGCRQLNIWMMKNKELDRGSEYYMAIGAWFIPVFGFLYIAIFVIKLGVIVWKDTPSGKWFMEGGKWFPDAKKWFTGEDEEF